MTPYNNQHQTVNVASQQYSHETLLQTLLWPQRHGRHCPSRQTPGPSPPRRAVCRSCRRRSRRWSCRRRARVAWTVACLPSAPPAPRLCVRRRRLSSLGAANTTTVCTSTSSVFLGRRQHHDCVHRHRHRHRDSHRAQCTQTLTVTSRWAGSTMQCDAKRSDVIFACTYNFLMVCFSRAHLSPLRHRRRRLSVRLSVTSRYHVKTNAHSITRFLPPDKLS